MTIGEPRMPSPDELNKIQADNMSGKQIKQSNEREATLNEGKRMAENERPKLSVNEIKFLINNLEEAQSKLKENERHLSNKLDELKSRRQQKANGIKGDWLDKELSLAEERVGNAQKYLADATKQLESAKDELTELGIELG